MATDTFMKKPHKVNWGDIFFILYCYIIIMYYYIMILIIIILLFVPDGIERFGGFSLGRDVLSKSDTLSKYVLLN
jgi:hypothetical protein